MQTSALLLRALYVYMRDEDLATDELVRKTGLTLDQPEQMPTTIDPSTLTTAIQVAMQSGAGAGLALKMGATTPLWTLGTFGELIAHCSTLRGAVEAVQHFLPLLQRGGTLRLVEAGQIATLYYEPPAIQGPERRFAIELAFSMFVAVARRFLGKSTRPRRLLLPYPAPEYCAEYHPFFRCPVVFNTDSAALLFDRAALDVQRPFADDQLRAWLETRLERVLRAEDGGAPLHVRIRAILERDASFVPAAHTFRAVSQRLGLTPRAVRRRLCAEGLTMSSLIDEARKQLAINLVVDADLPIKHIPQRLGFSELSTFYRAFKRWTGSTPSQFRALQHQQARADAA